MSEALLVISNLPDGASAQTLARHLVSQRLAACVNILPTVHSVYRWEGEIEEASEVTVLIKTSKSRYTELETAIRSMHAYDVPEIIALPITAGLPDYVQWLLQETKEAGDE